MADDSLDLVRVGRIAKAHGIQGEVVVRPDAAGSASLLTQQAAFLKPRDGEPERVEIASARTMHEAWLVRFAGCEDRTAAEKLAGREVWLPREALPALGEGEFYVEDLIGSEVRSVSGERLGEVVEVIETGAVPILEIQGDRRFQVPLVDTFVKEIDVEDGVVVVEAPVEEG